MKHRDTTKANYYTVWKPFNKFFLRLDVRPSSWEQHLTLFVGHLIHEKKQSSTVRSYISAIKAVLADANIKLNEDHFLITSMTKACRLINDKVRTCLPIQKSMLNSILKTVDDYFGKKKNNKYLQLLYKTIFSIMYFGLLRVSEVTKGAHPILAGDVRVGTNKKKMLLILRSSKTHGRYTAPQQVKITASKLENGNKSCRNPRPELPCPFQLLSHYAKARGPYKTNSDPFFVLRDGTPLKPYDLRKILKKMIKKAGFDKNAFDTHSLHIGRSCNLYRLGISVETIKKIGQWWSNAVFRYLRNV